ncbi:MAG: chemotaxis protein CheX [Sedimentisphaerales bacterium]|jgi:chemotaxis protein CheX|nr:chemotaxis protein CheX [Sedimentisphaerales bacterium]NLZ04121.1 chemotaxis protein CheX [Phycisphaerae bacterium]HNY78035.1 chemotaxis protein CheX [Sedimentisphaerales bacterium]HOC63247.1 chemotaxis protein CheX [Sedimentisphaerales bacterium]HOH64210.1 chemotaxis protein CheX [Sedimentisphaerales bacterium]
MITTMSLRDSLLDSAKEVFETMAFMALEEVADEQEGPGLENETLLGTITFKGDLEGCLAICCGCRCARTIGANMLGADPDEPMSDNDMSDAIGEVANMVMGALKARIQEEVGTMEVSIPSVVRGRELRNSLGERASKISVMVNLEEEHSVQFSLLYRESQA